MPAGKMKYKQLLNNFWADFHSFAKQFWGNSKISIVYKKKQCTATTCLQSLNNICIKYLFQRWVTAKAQS